MINSRDETIIEYLSARDERALGLAAVEYGPYIRRIAENILVDERDVEECFNDVMLRLWNTPRDAFGHGVAPVVGVITRCVCLNRDKARLRRKRVPSYMTEALETLGFEPRGSENTEDRFFASELAGHINDWLRTLDPTDRYIFISRFFESEPVKRIAEETGMSAESVFKKLQKLKKVLKNILERNGYTI